jgi:hypothetical protein
MAEAIKTADPTGTQEPTMPHNHLEEKAIFGYLLRPSDSYDENGVYWADMGLGRRFSFVCRYDWIEFKREVAFIGGMIKADPLSPVHAYFKNYVLPGAGLGLEG